MPRPAACIFAPRPRSSRVRYTPSPESSAGRDTEWELVHIVAPSTAGGVVLALLLLLFLARRRSKRKRKYNDGEPIYAEVSDPPHAVAP